MPALGPVLGADGVKNVVAYVRSMSGLPHDGLKAQLGKVLFTQNCAACHGPEGKGNQALGAPNLTDQIWLYGSSEATIAEGINNGRHLGITPRAHADAGVQGFARARLAWPGEDQPRRRLRVGPVEHAPAEVKLTHAAPHPPRAARGASGVTQMDTRTIPIQPVPAAPADGDEVGLYEIRRKIYPRAVTGWFRNWRVAMIIATQLVFYGLPWLSWNDRQAVLFDLAARKFYIFGIVFWPQDVIYLTVLLILSALSLFLFTAVAGRLWCGYACPQTVYTEIFLWIERKIEGDSVARKRLDAEPASLRKFVTKALKHTAWITLALWTGYTFVGYFTPIRDLGIRAITWNLGGVGDVLGVLLRVRDVRQRRLDARAGLHSKIQINELKAHGVDTAEKLSAVPLPLPWKPDRGSVQAYNRVREQARIQVEARKSGIRSFELMPIETGFGLTRLPEPSAADIFLDLEGDPFVGEHGLEYLFGYVTEEAHGQFVHHHDWALTRADEKRAFERFVDFVMERWERHPDLHIYHYAPYEPGALKRLMGRYATREEEIDRMLRAGLFVDLYQVVRHALRASVESYSIKRLERFFGFERQTPLSEANSALARLESHLELGDTPAITDEMKSVVLAYNRRIAARRWLCATGSRISGPSSWPRVLRSRGRFQETASRTRRSATGSSRSNGWLRR